MPGPSPNLSVSVQRGAGPSCWVISENSDLDGKEADLLLARKETIGYQMGTIISCIPGKLWILRGRRRSLPSRTLGFCECSTGHFELAPANQHNPNHLSPPRPSAKQPSESWATFT